MKIKTKNHSTKKYFIILLVLILIIIGAITFEIIKIQPWKTNVTTNSESKKNNSSTLPNKNLSNTSSDNSTSITNSDAANHTPTQYEGTNPNNDTELSGFINYKNVTSNQLSIRITINQLLNTGTCDLTLTNGSKSFAQTADIIENPSSSTCKGFDIPLSRLSSGKWQININIKSNGKAGIITGEVSI